MLPLCGLPAAAEPAGHQTPDGLYLEAYLAMQDAVSLERAGDLQDAANSMEIARRKFARVQANWPEWNPRLLEHRLDQINEALAELMAGPDGPIARPLATEADEGIGSLLPEKG